MSQVITNRELEIERGARYSEAVQIERHALGLPPFTSAPASVLKRAEAPGSAAVKKRAICAPAVLNEALDYSSAFSRGLRVELSGGITHLLLSGTASIGPNGETLYPGDFRAQCWRTYHNLTRLLENEGATWHDVVRTTCYLRDIERDYGDFNSVRTEFFQALALDPLPASTGIQARLCRSELLIEIEAQAILDRGKGVR
jgi:enamine deaminase RidA (YjgF/YER057c/UK114 family)